MNNSGNGTGAVVLFLFAVVVMAILLGILMHTVGWFPGVVVSEAALPAQAPAPVTGGQPVDVTKLQARLADTEEQLASLEGQLAEVEQELATTHDDNEVLRKRIATLKATIADKEQVIAYLKSQLNVQSTPAAPAPTQEEVAPTATPMSVLPIPVVGGRADGSAKEPGMLPLVWIPLTGLTVGAVCWMISRNRQAEKLAQARLVVERRRTLEVQASIANRRRQAIAQARAEARARVQAQSQSRPQHTSAPATVQIRPIYPQPQTRKDGRELPRVG